MYKSNGEKMKVKFDKYWGQCNLLITLAAILDPRNKMKLIEFTFEAIYSKEDAPKYIKVVHDSLYEIYQKYADAYTTDIDKNNTTYCAQDRGSASNPFGGAGKGKSIITGIGIYRPISVR